MAFQLSDIVTKVQQRVRDTGYSSSEINNYINDTQNDVFNEYRLPFMQTSQNYTLAVNTSDITNGSGLPSNFVQAIDIFLTTTGREKVLEYIDFAELDKLYADLDDTTANPANVPNYWYKIDDTIRVFPVPNAAYTLTMRYYKKPTILSANADVPEIPSQFEEVLVVGAAYRVMQAKDNYDQAGILENKYDELLQKMVVRFSQPQVGTAIRIPINRTRTSKRF